MSDIAIVYSVLAAVVVLFVWNRLPVEIVAIGAALTLVATDVLTVDEALAGLGDQAVIFIATLFVVSEGLDATGVTTWAGQRLIASVGDSRTRLIVLMMLLVAALTALISVNGAVAALLPMVVVIALRLGQSTVAAPDAAGVRRPRRFAAGAHGQPGEHPRVGGRRRRERHRIRLSRVRNRRCAAARRHDRRRRAVRVAGCFRTGSRTSCRPI